jgi:hypothetical protein
MSQNNEGLDVVLVAPTDKELTATLTRAVKAANSRCRTARVELSEPTAAELRRSLVAEPEGQRQWLGGPCDRDLRSALAVAWWTDRLGRKHVRIKGARWKFGYDRHAEKNILCPHAEDRPPVWMVYPDLIYLAGSLVLAACPCGVAGTLDAIGWMGDRCAACHDRAEEDQALPGWQRIAPWKVQYNSIEAVSFSPDNCLLAACTITSGPHVRDLATGESRNWKGGGFVLETDLAFLADGNLAVAHGREVVILDPRKLDRHDGFQRDGSFSRLTPSADGALLATAGSGMWVWDLRSGEQRFPISSAGTRGGPYCVVFHPDGHSLVVGWSDRTIRWWRTERGTEGATWAVPGPQGGGVQELAISPDGRYLASLVADKTNNLHIWDPATGKVLATWTLDRKGYHPNSGMRLIAFAPDGRTLAASERDGILKFWDVVAGDDPVSLGSDPGGEIHTLAFSPDGRWLATGDQRSMVKLWPWQALLAAARAGKA